MRIAFLALASVLSLAASPPLAGKQSVCTKLEKEFYHNELIFAVAYRMDKSFADIDQETYEKMEEIDRPLLMEEAKLRAIGVYVPRRAESPYKRKAEAAQQKLKETEKEFKAEGDRITTLLIANGCKPPDHVTSPYTYASELANKTDPNP